MFVESIKSRPKQEENSKERFFKIMPILYSRYFLFVRDIQFCHIYKSSQNVKTHFVSSWLDLNVAGMR